MVSISNELMKIDWDFPNSFTNGNIHSIHPYPAKFIPEIPKTLIEIIGVPPNTWVFDPFCGSGTTLVEAQLAGIPSLGIDINPIACLLSKVKTQRLYEDFLENVDQVVELAKEDNSSSIPLIPNLDHWYNKDIQQIISRLCKQINKITDSSIKNAMEISLSRILVRISNQESDTRYAAIKKKQDVNRIYDLFTESANKIYLANIKHKPNTNDVEVVCNDILQVKPNEIKHPIGLVITSPPYPNAYEYWLYHKYRMYWLGFDPIDVKKKEIGARAHYFKKNPQTEIDFQHQMQKVLELLNVSVVSGGHICIIVGRSKIHGKIIDNANNILELGKSMGLHVVANLPRNIASTRKTFNLAHSNINSENILIFEKK